jgi:hypothetical protein
MTQKKLFDKELKKLAVCFAFLFFSLKVFAQADPAKWKKIFENQNYEIFIDPGSIRPITNPQITSKGFTFIDMIPLVLIFA